MKQEKQTVQDEEAQEEEGERPKKSEALLLAGVGCSLLGVALLFILAATPARSFLLNLFGSVNLVSLATAAVFMLLSFAVAYPLALRRRMGSASRAGCWAGLFVSAANVVFLICSMNQEICVFDSQAKNTFLFRMPMWLRTGMVCALAALFLFLLKGTSLLRESRSRKGGVLFASAAALLAVLTVFSCYWPNPLNGSDGNLYHLHAYFNSVYNVAQGIPFSADVGSIYGHYAFFLAPVLRLAFLLGKMDLLRVFMLLEALLQGAIVLLYAYVLKVLIQNSALRIAALFGVCFTSLSMEYGIYVQMMPHRALPYAVLAALVAWWYDKPLLRKRICVFGYFVCALLIVWSTECGVVATLAWAALSCAYVLQKKGLCSWGAVAAHLAACVASFWGALGIVQLCNLAMGGQMLSVQDFLFPLLTKSYMQGYLEQPLYAGPAAWVSISAVLFFFLAKGLSSFSLFHKTSQKNARSAVCFALGALGLGTLTYAFNRPAYGNFYLTMPLMAVLLAMLAQAALPEAEATLSHGIFAKRTFSQTVTGCAGLTVLCVMGLQMLFGIANYGSRQDRRLPLKDTYSIECLTAYAVETAENVKQLYQTDIVAMGRGAQAVYASLGWQTGAYVMDYSDITISPWQLQYADDFLGTLDGRCLLIDEDAMAIHAEANLQGYQRFMRTHTLAENETPPSEVTGLKLALYVPLEQQAD